MSETLEPCCEKARQGVVARLRKGIASYPVIKAVPCPTCRRVIQIRLYAPPRNTPPNDIGDGAA